MKRTFTYFLFFAFALISFSACKKDSGSNSGGGYYIKFKRDGKEIKMTYSPQAVFADVSLIGLYNGTFEAFTSDGKTTMLIIIYDASPVAAGKTYTQDFLSTASLPQAQLAYTDETTTGYSSGSTILNPDASTTVSISDLTDTYIKGTFSGKLLTSDYKGIKYTITDGEFYLKIVK